MTYQELCQSLWSKLLDEYNIDISQSDKIYIGNSKYFRNEYAKLGSRSDPSGLVKSMAERISSGLPAAYVIQEAVFMDLTLFVNDKVLIPRPETEELAYWIESDHRNAAGNLKVLDVGCGSGCLSLYLKTKFKGWEITGLDVSMEALAVCERNAADLNCSVKWVCDDFLNSTFTPSGPYDILVSNPPYIGDDERNVMDPSVLKYEPNLALFAPGNDPLIFYKKLSEFGKQHLRKGGRIYVELNEFLAQETMEVFIRNGFQAELKEDLQKKPRMIKATRPG